MSSFREYFKNLSFFFVLLNDFFFFFFFIIIFFNLLVQFLEFQSL